ncbi:reticulon-4-interacting protein 1 homolog, mitochondrial-like [Anoplophora glabripennis]|uniref:reticulon-4-interacting protein 1 homolog, mitochondrial-like n=1 Tax=Anoplophora glabripennis TaxID=217634 RepID=UPI0008743957|nr:reticulon-4-interacting protein 1 homolog, mitochondrial-like [Anoplophora glabripennis]
MDEVLFRSSQKIENMQLQAELTATKTKEALVLYSQQGRLLVAQLWHSSIAEQLKASLKEVSSKIVSAAKDVQARIIYIFDPRYIYRNFIIVFGRKWTKRDVCFGCAGFILGGIIGLGVGLALRKKEPVIRYMQTVQCNHYLGAESVTVVEDAIAPYECQENEVLINVKAGSVQGIDLQICSGYGRTLRKILNNVFKQSNSDLPVILGRDCTGIITDIGSKVKRLEVGDEVWFAVPFWSQGTLCQSVLVSENQVSRKPKSIGFEGACSLPYAGSIALSALEEANIHESNASNKKILVEGGCTPVGCVLIQLLKNWKATVTATCLKRAVPVVKALGASDIIILAEPTNPNNNSSLENEERILVENALLKELDLRGNVYDAIIKTSYECNVIINDFKKFCVSDGAVVSTLPPILSSDSYGFLKRMLLTLYINLKCRLQKTLGLPITDFDEIHLCYVTLDRLASFVEDGSLQTVVDKVFSPQDIEIALNHIQSPHSIGSTILTFR